MWVIWTFPLLVILIFSTIFAMKKAKKPTETELTASLLKERSKPHKRLKERFLIRLIKKCSFNLLCDLDIFALVDFFTCRFSYQRISGNKEGKGFFVLFWRHCMDPTTPPYYDAWFQYFLSVYSRVILLLT